MSDDDGSQPRPEIRIDQLTGLRAILAPGRERRPSDFEPAASAGQAADSCPFCAGREERTPPEVWARRPEGGAADGPGWRQRAVPNLYPALVADAGPARGLAIGRSGSEAGLTSSADPLRASNRVTTVDLFGSAPAQGEHEVIVNHPEHRLTLAALGPDGLAEAIAAWRERIAAHRRRPPTCT